MMVMLMKHGRAEECLKYWRQLVCVNGLNGVVINPETYNFAIKCTCAVDNLDEMEAVLEMMEVCVSVCVCLYVCRDPVALQSTWITVMVAHKVHAHHLFYGPIFRAFYDHQQSPPMALQRQDGRCEGGSLNGFSGLVLQIMLSVTFLFFASFSPLRASRIIPPKYWPFPPEKIKCGASLTTFASPSIAFRVFSLKSRKGSCPRKKRTSPP